MAELLLKGGRERTMNLSRAKESQRMRALAMRDVNPLKAYSPGP